MSKRWFYAILGGVMYGGLTGACTLAVMQTIGITLTWAIAMSFAVAITIGVIAGLVVVKA